MLSKCCKASHPFSDFSDFQVHRHSYIPQIPLALKESHVTAVKLHEESYPIAEGLTALFPTLLGPGMKYFELRQDHNGALAKSDRPIKVS